MMQISIKDEDIAILDVVEMFFQQMSPDEVKEQNFEKFKEYLHRLKGTNSMLHERIVEEVVENMFWAGIWYGKKYADEISIEEIDDESEEPQEENKEEPSRFDRNEYMFG